MFELIYLAHSLPIIVVVMTAGWLVSKKFTNAGIVDVIWGFSFAALAIYFSFIGTAPNERKFLLLAAIVPWSVRLGVYLTKRFLHEFPKEDKRYAAWRAEWKDKATFNMFWVFQLQGALIAILSLPFAIVANDQWSSLRLTEWLAALICTVGWIGEAIADEQLRTFKSDPINKGLACQSGLWNYSRHPNYFFEWIVWIGIFVFSIQSPHGAYAVICPLLMFVFLTKVSGVTLAEEHLLKDRGAEYKKYIESTSSFFPWFKSAANAQKR